MKNEGNESVTKYDKLKMFSLDGKYYLTDVADTETILRLIQSIPSPKAEPFKLWLTRVGYERIMELIIKISEIYFGITFYRFVIKIIIFDICISFQKML